MRSAGVGALAYYGDEALNRTQFPGGWARTGDLGRVDPDGRIRLVGRAKELLFLRGGRLPPEYVEEILARRIPAGLDFAVTGVPTPGGWDRIAVFLAGGPDGPDGVGGDEGLAAARQALERMSGPFRPQIVRILTSIPRTPAGKPRRRTLTDLLASEAQA